MVEREFYMGIMDFLDSSKGAYSTLDNFTCRDILEALDDGRYRLTTDGGRITSFSTWWMVHETDLESVKNGIKPADVSTGNICYVADHAGRCSRMGLVKFIREEVAPRACWHHRYKDPKQFRTYSEKEGSHNVKI